MIADFAFSFRLQFFSLRRINQSIKSLRHTDLGKTCPLPLSQSIVNEIGFRPLNIVKLSIISKQNYTSRTMIITHLFIAPSSQLCYAMLPIPCTLYFVSLNSFSHILFGSGHCQPTLSVSKRPKQTHANLSMQSYSENAHLK